MTPEEAREKFGPDYPQALTRDGVRIPLHSETRFRRVYRASDSYHYFSRFMDGSATLTLDQLRNEWPLCDESLRAEFCSECGWLSEQPDFPDMLRFLMKNADTNQLSALALPIAGSLPADEAFDFLCSVMAKVPPARAANFAQAISHTRHPKADATLRNHLATLWSDPALWEDDSFVNWTAYSATCCIKNLLKMGAPPADFGTKVEELSKHVCTRNRESCMTFLAEFYPWLSDKR